MNDILPILTLFFAFHAFFLGCIMYNQPRGNEVSKRLLKSLKILSINS